MGEYEKREIRGSKRPDPPRYVKGDGRVQKCNLGENGDGR